MAYETRVDLYVCQTTWMATMMLSAMPRRWSSIAGRMIGMTRDALCVNVNSLVSALAQRSTCGHPPHSRSSFTLTVSLWRLPTMVGMHDDLAFPMYDIRCSVTRSYTAHVIHIWEVNYWQVTHIWLSWDSRVGDVRFESGWSPEPALIP